MSEVKERTWVRNTIFALSQPILPPTGILPTIIHEGAHWISALIIGIPSSEIKLGWYVLGPGVAIPLSTPPKYLPYFFYSGGLTSGTIVLILYVSYWIKKYQHIPSVTNWIMSMLTIWSVAIQLYFGFLEGRYQQSYPSHINQLQLLIFITVATLFHAALFYFISRYRRKRV